MTELYDSAATYSLWREEITGLWKYRVLVWELTRRNIAVRYKRSFIGALWSIMDPLLTMIIMTIVFSRLLGRTVAYFPIFLLSGLLVYSFFLQATQGSIGEFRQAGRLLTKIYMPRSAFVLVAVFGALINLLIGLLLLLFLAVVVMQMPVTWTWLGLVVPILLGTLFAVGWGLMLAPVSVLYADVSNIYNAVLRLVMYLSAIFYNPERFSGWTRMLIEINPIYQLIALARDAVYYHQWPSAASAFYMLAWSLLSLVVGWVVFRRFIEDAILTL